jgi:activator of HSP90 ATPase
MREDRAANSGGKMIDDRKKNNGAVSTPTRRQMIAGVAVAFGGLSLGPAMSWAAAEEEISHTAESIHQEPVFKASRKRVYEALTDAKQFNAVVQLSAAMKSAMPPGTKPGEISREAGGAFSLFGGYVTGRQIELVPNERIVQAWRAGGWDPGIYSIARFELVEAGAGTKIVFDHTGFPKGDGEHLAAGWKMNYWEPLEKFLA